MSFEVTKLVCLCLIANFVIITDKHKIVAAAPAPLDDAARHEMAPLAANRLHPEGKARLGRTRLFYDNNGKFKSSEQERNGHMVNIAHIVVEQI